MDGPLQPIMLVPRGEGYQQLRKELGQCLGAAEQEPPPDYVLWSLFNTIFLNCYCCLGFLALTFSVKSRDRKMVGDLEGARHYGATAKIFNVILAVFLFLSVVAGVVIIWITV